MNSFETPSTETEQKQREPGLAPTTSRVIIPTQEPKREAPPMPAQPEAVENIRQEASSPFTGELSFACLLIPRFNDHYLTGDITGCLAEWLGQVCVSYGWRLETIVVRPGYIQWIVTVPLTVNPAQIIRLVRRHTSMKIFDEFPRFRQKNMSGDFWAPGYFITSGKQPLPLETISDFTQTTRRQQGLY